MKDNCFILVFILYTQLLFAQKVLPNEYSSIDKTALQLPDSIATTSENIANYITSNFKSDNDRVRAIFIWVAANIRYDVENMFAINFSEKKEDKVAKTLKSRKGICENYAAIFNDICEKAGIKSFIIEGYTKQNGFADYIPHAWNAVMIDTSWFLFDPTWASGYIDGGKFHPKINNAYYKITPSSHIKSHMPFDYLWQFLNYPINNQEFYEGKTQQNKTKPYFNYIDSIYSFEKLNYIDQLIASAGRIEKSGIKNSLIFERLKYLKYEIEFAKQNTIVTLYNLAVVDFNDAVKLYNDFINYRNKKFTPIKTDPEIQNMINAADNKLRQANQRLEK